MDRGTCCASRRAGFTSGASALSNQTSASTADNAPAQNGWLNALRVCIVDPGVEKTKDARPGASPKTSLLAWHFAIGGLPKRLFRAPSPTFMNGAQKIGCAKAGSFAPSRLDSIALRKASTRPMPGSCDGVWVAVVISSAADCDANDQWLTSSARLPA